MDGLRLNVGFVTDTGQSRERNEDAYALYLPYDGEVKVGPLDGLFVLADGMGGHEGGDLASRFVADAIVGALTRDMTVHANEDRAVVSPDAGATVAQWIARSVRNADRELRRLAKREGLANAGSTVTVAAVHDASLFLVHVGDSRGYRMNGGRLEQLTHDDSWVAEQVRAGVLTPDEAAAHPKRHMLTRCLGIGQPPTIEVVTHGLAAGDRFLLCTDGLHGVVPTDVVERVLVDEREPQQAAARLVRLANDVGGPDNITVIVFDVRSGVAAATTEPGTPALDPATTDPGSPSHIETLAVTAVTVPARATSRVARALLVAGVLFTTGAATYGVWHYLSPQEPTTDPPLIAPAGDSTSTPSIPDTAGATDGDGATLPSQPEPEPQQPGARP
jgi:serine/threonine protein phosphatase PrpC